MIYRDFFVKLIAPSPSLSVISELRRPRTELNNCRMINDHSGVVSTKLYSPFVCSHWDCDSSRCRGSGSTSWYCKRYPCLLLIHSCMSWWLFLIYHHHTDNAQELIPMDNYTSLLFNLIIFILIIHSTTRTLYVTNSQMPPQESNSHCYKNRANFISQ